MPSPLLVVIALVFLVMSFSEANPSPDQLHGHLHNRNEWSQLVGQEGSVVAEIIQKERPELQVVTVPHVSAPLLPLSACC